MDVENRIIELEKKVAVLEYRVQEQREWFQTIKSGMTTVQGMIRQIQEDPFRLNSEEGTNDL